MLRMMEDGTKNQSQDLANRCFQDINWLMYFPLISPPAVLHYFAISPFFDPETSNQTLRNQGREQRIEFLKEMKGKEFIVNESLSKPPRLFIIQKQLRQSPASASVLQVYYCLDGSIFQCQNLLEILRSRYEKVSIALMNAYRAISEKDEEDPQSSQ